MAKTKKREGELSYEGGFEFSKAVADDYKIGDRLWLKIGDWLQVEGIIRSENESSYFLEIVKADNLST